MLAALTHTQSQRHTAPSRTDHHAGAAASSIISLQDSSLDVRPTPTHKHQQRLDDGEHGDGSRCLSCRSIHQMLHEVPSASAQHDTTGLKSVTHGPTRPSMRKPLHVEVQYGVARIRPQLAAALGSQLASTRAHLLHILLGFHQCLATPSACLTAHRQAECAHTMRPSPPPCTGQ